jgi:hypothetical protein
MRETRSKKSFFHSLTLASSDYAKDKLFQRERKSLCLMPKFELNTMGEDDKEGGHV